MIGMSTARPRGRRNRARVWLRDTRIRLREWLLEDSANVGLGGPPNNWQATKVRAESHSGSAEYGARFANDAFEVGLSIRFPDEPGDEGRWLGHIPAPVFRRLALWYLWRWAYGEWFGLRRRLFYHWLHRHVARMTRPTVVAPLPGDEEAL